MHLKTKTNILKILFTIIITLSVWNSIFAEPFYFNPKIIESLKYEVIWYKKISEKLTFVDLAIEKMWYLQNNKKEKIIRDMKEYRNSIVLDNLRSYTIEKYLSSSWAIDYIKSSKKSYQVLRLKDIRADIHQNYLDSLETKIKTFPELNEEANLYKSYIYILYSILSSKEKGITTLEKLASKDTFINSQEYTQNKDMFDWKITKLIAAENIKLYSKNDFQKITEKIKSENISPGSDYMKGYLWWYAKYYRILLSDSILVNSWTWHEKQAYNLSCEANSAKDLVNHYARKNNLQEIKEDDILTKIPSYTWWLWTNEQKELMWQDPTSMFVWDILWTQSTNPNKFTWYWVYANPIIASIRTPLNKINIEPVKLDLKEEKQLIELVNNWDPVIFWYLSKVKKWNKYWFNVSPLNWKTPSWKVISWYIWEHTWILIWIDLSRDGKIENVYYYEWRSEKIQKMEYDLFLNLTSYFNQMITTKKLNSPAWLIANK